VAWGVLDQAGIVRGKAEPEQGPEIARGYGLPFIRR
jgi:hypothetical protein